MTKRRKISTKERVSIFQERKGECLYCKGKIIPGDPWELAHVIDRELKENDPDFDADDRANLAPAHYRCHRAYTYEEGNPAISRAKRLEAKHIGAFRKPSRWSCGKQSGLKKKMDGTVVRREK